MARSFVGFDDSYRVPVPVNVSRAVSCAASPRTRIGAGPRADPGHRLSARADMVFVGAQLPVDAKGRLVGEGDLAAQTHAAMRHMRAALIATDSGFDEVVKVNARFTGDWDESAWGSERRHPLRLLRQARTRLDRNRRPPPGDRGCDDPGRVRRGIGLNRYGHAPSRFVTVFAFAASSLNRDGERMVDQQAIRREKSEIFFLGLNEQEFVERVLVGNGYFEPPARRG